MTPSFQSKLQRITFAIASIVEVCTEKGSYHREIASRVERQIRDEIDRIIAELNERKAAQGE